MRILCDACGAKYQVDDNKVRKRSFKFPCKKCGHTVVVRQSQSEEVAVASEEAFEATKQLNYDDHLAKQAKEDGAIWYVAVGQERVGPISADDVQAYIDQGQVTESSFVWADGMDDWSPLGEVPALARLLPERPNAVAATPSTAEQDDNDQTRGDVSPSPFSDPVPEDRQANPASDESDLFVSDHAEATFDEPGNSPVVSTSQLMGQRHENSVLFSLDSLDNEPQPDPSNLMHPNSDGNTEGSGLIDLAMLGGETDNLDRIFNSGAPNAAPMGAPIKPMASLVTQPRSNRMGLIIGASIFAALLAAGATFAVLKFTQKDGETVVAKPTQIPPKPLAEAAIAAANKPEKKEKKEKALAAPTPKRKTAVDETAKTVSQATDKKNVAAVPTTPPKGVTPTRTVKKKAKTTPSWRNKSNRRTNTARRTSQRRTSPRASTQLQGRKQVTQQPKQLPKPRKPKQAGGSEAAALLASLDGGGGSKRSTGRPSRGASPLPSSPAPTVDPTLPDTLDRSQVLTSVRRNMAKVRDCRRLEPDISGKVVVKFVISGSGRVSSASPRGQYANTQIGRCVAQKVRTIRFPRFSGKPITISSFPFSL